MNTPCEIHSSKVLCEDCRQCKPWVLCQCYRCDKKWWSQVTLAKRWCDLCYQKKYGLVNILLITGHEIRDTPSYAASCVQWAKLTTDRADLIIILAAKCKNSNLVPALRQVPCECWAVTKEKCRERFAWKLRKVRKLL